MEHGYIEKAKPFINNWVKNFRNRIVAQICLNRVQVSFTAAAAACCNSNTELASTYLV